MSIYFYILAKFSQYADNKGKVKHEIKFKISTLVPLLNDQLLNYIKFLIRTTIFLVARILSYFFIKY